MGFIANRSNHKIWKKNRSYLLTMVYKDDESKKTLGITNISGKMKLVKSVLEWVATVDGGYENDKFLKALKRQCESLDIGLLLETIQSIEEWCKYRNEVIHATLNKNLSALNLTLSEKVEQGMEYARILDGQVSILKKGNVIRRSTNAPRG